MSAIAFDPTLDFLALYADQTEDVILSRWIDWANEGLDPVADADQWVDTREGGHWRTTTTPVLRECARLYDLIGTEVPMVAFVLWAWGTYLDDLAETYDVQRNAAVQSTGVVTFSGTDGTIITAGTRVGTSPANPDDPAPSFSVTVEGEIAGGSIDLPIQAVDAGAQGDVAAGAITVEETPLPGVTFTNAVATGSGSDPESDDSLRRRVLQALEGKGPGTQADYVRWLSAIAGVGRVQVVPTWRGAGTVLGVITDADGQPLDTVLVSQAQTDLDPVPGQGSGTAPVGAAVTVETSSVVPIDVASTGTVFAEGYSADGAGGTVDVTPAIQSAIATYLLTVGPGASVAHSVVAGIISTAIGVLDAPNVTINGGSGNVPISLDPPETAVLALPVVLS